MSRGPTGIDSSVDSQDEVVRFLSNPSIHGLVGEDVAFVETHGARVFLAGAWAYKIKRNVQFDYMDFSTLALRRAALEREIEVNRAFAPQLYCDVIAITRGDDGNLSFGGAGTVVEWALKMRRFSQDRLLGSLAKAGPLDPSLCEAIGDLLVGQHGVAPPQTDAAGDARIGSIIEGVTSALDGAPGAALGRAQVDEFGAGIRSEYDAVKPLIVRRASAGFVRRCHGDLHLDNVVVLDDGPALFDAIEFSDEIATVDVMYDLAFLLMDLGHAGQATAANRIFNRYIWRDGSVEVVDGVGTLPLYQALRAGIRAMVLVQRFEQSGAQEAVEGARAYLETALKMLRPQPPRLIAVGGYSGTGKTTQACALAALIGRPPGAVHVRSDLERKALFGAAETERLPAEAYTTEASAVVYQRMLGRVERVLQAGWSIVVDAVFGREEERSAIAGVGQALEVPFEGVWLQAPSDLMVQRVAARKGDASDATPDVVAKQLERDPGTITWHVVDSSGTPSEVGERIATLFRLKSNAEP